MREFKKLSNIYYSPIVFWKDWRLEVSWLKKLEFLKMLQNFG